MVKAVRESQRQENAVKLLLGAEKGLLPQNEYAELEKELIRRINNGGAARHKRRAPRLDELDGDNE